MTNYINKIKNYNKLEKQNRVQKEKINKLETELKQFKGEVEEQIESFIQEGFYNPAYLLAKNLEKPEIKMAYYDLLLHKTNQTCSIWYKGKEYRNLRNHLENEVSKKLEIGGQKNDKRKIQNITK